jgi:hypothetical protein
MEGQVASVGRITVNQELFDFVNDLQSLVSFAPPGEVLDNGAAREENRTQRVCGPPGQGAAGKAGGTP